jgi:hypothetical protein
VTIEEASRVVPGNKLAEAIIADQGVHWAVVAAMCEAKTNHDPRALKAIRDWNAQRKSGGH